jgi:hypothetical protein
LARGKAVHERGDGNDEDPAPYGWKLIEDREALGDDVLVGREDVVWERFPIGKMEHRDIGGRPHEEAQLILEASRRGGIGRQDQQNTPMLVRGMA